MNSRMSFVVIFLALCLMKTMNVHSSSEVTLKRNDTLDLCKLPPETGPCRAAFLRWHFNSTVNECLQFTYGGCHGNGNNFDTERECTNTCSSTVVTTNGPLTDDSVEKTTQTPFVFTHERHRRNKETQDYRFETKFVNQKKDVVPLKISAHDLDPFLSIEDGHIAVHDERNEAYSFKRDSMKKVWDRYKDKQGSEAEDPKDSESSVLKNPSPSSDDSVDDEQGSKEGDTKARESSKLKNPPFSFEHSVDDKQGSEAKDYKDSENSKLKNTPPSSDDSVNDEEESKAEDPKARDSFKLKYPSSSFEDSVDDKQGSEAEDYKDSENFKLKNPSSWSEYRVEEDHYYIDDLDDRYSQTYRNDSSIFRGSDPLEHTSSHFTAFFLTSIVMVFAAYMIYRNRQKIVVIIRAGRNYGDSRRRGYRKLETNVEASTFVY